MSRDGAVAGEENLRARSVIVAIGRSGNYRRLGVPGEDLPKVYNRLHDPKDFAGQDVLVVGGGDTAVESAVLLAEAGANVSLSYRKPELVRPKPENRERLEQLASAGRVELRLASEVAAIGEREVVLSSGPKEDRVANDVVFTLVGREAPLGFFRKSGVPIRGESRALGWVLFAAFLLLCTWIYNWKSGGYLSERFAIDPELWTLSSDPGSFLGVLVSRPREAVVLVHARLHGADRGLRLAAHPSAADALRDRADRGALPLPGAAALRATRAAPALPRLPGLLRRRRLAQHRRLALPGPRWRIANGGAPTA